MDGILVALIVICAVAYLVRRARGSMGGGEGDCKSGCGCERKLP